MKKLLLMVMAVCVTIVVSAQKGRGGGIGRSRVIIVSPAIGFGYGSFYSPYGFSPFGYGYPYGYNYGYRRESKLDREVEGIKMDYADKIKSAKADKSLNRDERKTIIKQLKAERDNSIHDLKANYYKPQPKSPAATEKGETGS